MREKLRQFEIEASLERARLARERSNLDEKLRVLEQEKVHAAPDDTPPEADKPKSSRRWLARLGIKDE